MPSFRDLWIWKDAHQLMIEVHDFVKSLPADERFRKRDQIERSSSSVPDNIAEGYAAYYYKEKIKGMYVARREAAETQNHIEALVAKEYLSREDGDNWFERYEKVIAGINGYVNYICNKRKGKTKGKDDVEEDQTF